MENKENLTLLDAGWLIFLSFITTGSVPLDCDLVPEIPNSMTSKTVAIQSLSWRRYGWWSIQVLQQWNAATIVLCKSLEWAWRGREHWTTIKSQIHFNERLHSSDSFSKILVRAKPRSNSKAANEEFKSDFQDDIKRWQTKWAAFTNSEPKKICTEVNQNWMCF